MARWLLLLLFCLILPVSAPAYQHSHSSHRSSSTHSHSSSKPSSSSKPVHVGSYTRKDGTVVRAYDRSLPGTKEPKTPATHDTTEASPSVAATFALRDSHGRIKRSEEAKREFERQAGYPHGRPGYVVDHIKPLACGGADDPSNMQWQTVAEAKVKDKTERVGCK